VEVTAKNVSTNAIAATIVRVIRRMLIAHALVDGLDPSATHHASRASTVSGVKKNVQEGPLMVNT